ncbi:MAG TPA: alpha/beta hydrolase-fold protein [Chloroflexota bacterium]|nr:alpha/beta hydrolase-fold protein [Chloroflexota bacterium]
MKRFGPPLFALLVLLSAPGASVRAAGPSVAELRAAGADEVREVYVRPPATVTEGGPPQVVVALHGMGGTGARFAAQLEAQADRYGWLLVAPTIAYGDWTDPAQIAREEPALSAWLSDLIAHLPGSVGQSVQPRVLLFGYSRGAQLALRFAEIHPEQVAGVAATSAGTYTLPEMHDDDTGQPLSFPFGVANLAREDGGRPFNAREFRAIPIWVAVGANDSNPADVPDAWDPYIGDDRLERAERFAAALTEMGADVRLRIFPGATHGLTDEMRAAGCAALAAAADS